MEGGGSAGRGQARSGDHRAASSSRCASCTSGKAAPSRSRFAASTGGTRTRLARRSTRCARELNGWAIDDVRDATGAVVVRRGQQLLAVPRHARRRLDALGQLALHRDVHRRRQPDAAPLDRRPERPGPLPRVGVQLAGQPARPLQPLLGRRAGPAVGSAARRHRVERPALGRRYARTTRSTARPTPASARSSCCPKASRGCSCPASSSRGRGRSTTSRPSRRCQPLHPAQSSNPAVRPLQRRSSTCSARRSEFPIVCTTYRLTEHFHYWTKNNPYSVQLQPEFFVEMPEELAREKGIANGDRVRVTSARGEIEGRAMVTRRIKPMQVGGRTVYQIGFPIHWGFLGRGQQRGSLANLVTPTIVDPELVRARVQGVSGEAGEGVTSRARCRVSATLVARARRACGSRPSSSSSTPRRASAARPARWPVRSGTTCRPSRRRRRAPTRRCPRHGQLLEPDQVQRARGARAALHWLMRKDQCMHCAEPGCLIACPGAGRHRAVRQRHRRLPAGPVHRLRLLHHRLSVRRAEVQPQTRAASTSARCASIACRWACSRRA